MKTRSWLTMGNGLRCKTTAQTVSMFEAPRDRKGQSALRGWRITMRTCEVMHRLKVAELVRGNKDPAPFEVVEALNSAEKPAIKAYKIKCNQDSY